MEKNAPPPLISNDKNKFKLHYSIQLIALHRFFDPFYIGYDASWHKFEDIVYSGKGMRGVIIMKWFTHNGQQ